ncbi:hypothetical protein DLAC_08702 [Tieghemostelium lacteum]|uniref:Ribokinase n=1 Tax=Tieghemostelium lacteum TaxID=361077 RepID=A0A151Z859_TIELA|nr:hypothetical protein DLAC_08702 [Tieghemostelium lacteum]|eukprot:KYQ90118.1 hypothetical protein DLAC_08702 [Tieghemostelium lacteum]
MSHENSLVVVGATNWDMFTYCDEMPKPGETVKGSDFKVAFGGKAANQAVQAARLGSSVSIVTKIGDDLSGKKMLENFKNQNVNTLNVSVEGNDIPSGCATIIVDKHGENKIIIVGGTNSLLSKVDIDNAKDTIKQSNFVVCQLEVQLETTLAALKLAKQCNRPKTILNAAPFTKDPILSNEILQYVDILIVNEIEVFSLSGVNPENQDSNDIDNLYRISSNLLEKFAKIQHLIITVGSKGQVLVSREFGNHFIPITGEKVKVVDTTGAGDSFIGSFAHYLNQDPQKSYIEAIKKASKVATLSVQKHGAQPSYPSKEDLN